MLLELWNALQKSLLSVRLSTQEILGSPGGLQSIDERRLYSLLRSGTFIGPAQKEPGSV